MLSTSVITTLFVIFSFTIPNKSLAWPFIGQFISRSLTMHYTYCTKETLTGKHFNDPCTLHKVPDVEMYKAPVSLPSTPRKSSL